LTPCLGVPLLYRTTRNVELAPAGEVMLARGREILDALDAAIDDAGRAAGGKFGQVAIGLTGSSTYAGAPGAGGRDPARAARRCS
jgi:DNA-binding transcriptional LysR family regulator